MMNTNSNNLKNKNSIQLKVIILGAYSVGKTSIIRRYTTNKFTYQVQATIGANFCSKTIVNPLFVSSNKNTNNERDRKEVSSNYKFLSLQIWDTSGLERGGGYSSSLGECFFRHADGALLVYDATSFLSFLELTLWYSNFMQRFSEEDETEKILPLLIVANKLDVLRMKVKEKLAERVPQRNVLNVPNIEKISDAELKRKLIGRGKQPQGKMKENFQKVEINEINFDLRDMNNSYLPDRDVVIFWCQERGLIHVEVSALDGEGVEEAMETIAIMILKSKNIQSRNKNTFSIASNYCDQTVLSTSTIRLENRYYSVAQSSEKSCLKC